MKIGEIIPADREITLNEGKNTVKILVANKGDRPVQVGSHYHFFEVNKCLSFDRETAYGYHLDIPSGTSVRPLLDVILWVDIYTVAVVVT